MSQESETREPTENVVLEVGGQKFSFSRAMTWQVIEIGGFTVKRVRLAATLSSDLYRGANVMHVEGRDEAGCHNVWVALLKGQQSCWRCGYICYTRNVVKDRCPHCKCPDFSG